MAKQFLEHGLARPQATGLTRGDLEALRTFLARIDRLGGGLGGAAYEHVVQGHDPRVLLQVATCAKQAPARTHMLGYTPDASERHLFLRAEGWDADIARRLGEVLAALAGQGRLGYGEYLKGCTRCPLFFFVLMRVTARCLEDRAGAPPDTWLLNGPRCLELLALEGADPAVLVEALLGSEERWWWTHGTKRLQAMRGLPEVLAAAPQRMLFGARALPVKARSAFIELLGQRGLCEVPELLDFLLGTVAQAGRQQSDAALVALMSCNPARLLEEMGRRLSSADPEERRAAVRVLTNAPRPGVRALLEQRLPAERSAKVREQIEQGVRALKVQESPAAAAPEEGSGYVSINGDWIVIPDAAPPPPDTPPPPELADALRVMVHEATRAARRIFEEFQKQRAQMSPEERERHRGPQDANVYIAAAIPELLAILSGRRDPLEGSPEAMQLTGDGATNLWYEQDVVQPYKKKLVVLLSHPAITVHHLARLLGLRMGRQSEVAIAVLYGASVPAQLLRRMADAAGDFRPVLRACARWGAGPESVLRALLVAKRRPRILDDSRVARALWPTVAEHLDLIDQALGLAPVPPEVTSRRLRGLELLALLPAPPRRYLHTLVDLAVKAAQEERVLARALLASLRGRELIVPFLASGDQNRRMAAAQWLRERGEREAIPDLRAALAREKRQAARAVLLEALAGLGEDISDQISRDRLIKEARVGLTRTQTNVSRCLPLERLPALQWADGQPVPSEVARWWVVLADKLQRPRGDPMLHLLLDQLEQQSAEQLSMLALSSFVAYDTRRPSEAEASAYAEAHADRLVAQFRRWRADFTREQALAQLRAGKLREYVQSAIAHRGILALARRGPAGEVVSLVKAYFRDHSRRTAQCKALLDALASHSSPLALQLLFEISARHRTRGVRAHAAALLRSVAEERGWTSEELADRTVPTGGLDERGVLTLEPGDSPYTAVLDARLKVVLRNAQGKIVKALAGGSGEQAAGAKKRLSRLRKELQQTVPQQSARLYEAMCVGRIWRTQEAAQWLFRHPIVGRLCQRLIFAGVAEGKTLQTFRPLSDGSFTSAADEPVDITPFTGVLIAHRVLLDEEQASAWQQHIEDYEVALLFEQLARTVLRFDPAHADPTAIREREGYMLETSTLHAAAAKLGYQRGPAEGAWLFSYQKRFAASGLAAVVDFSGSSLAEVNAPCALTGLRFTQGEAGEHSTPLREVPPVLLCEAWNDLRTLAAAGTGFDPDWRKRVSHG